MTATPHFQITGTTRVYGMIADPIAHVRAPMVYNPVFEERGIDAVMVPLHLTPENLAPAIRALVNVPNFGGVCVSIPHKMELAAICDELGLAAQLTGAVNAVRFENGRLIGDNFDGKGFVAGLQGEGISIAGKSILMIGAGGAARAIAAALAETDARRIDISNRTTAKAAEIIAMLAPLENTPQLGVIDSSSLSDALADADIIINTTSLGLHEGDALPCQLDNARADAVVAEIIMIPAETEWMKAAANRGMTVHAGRHMLDYQRDLMGVFLQMWN